MDFRDKGVQTQLRNIEEKTGRPLAALKDEVLAYGPLRHAEKRARLQDAHGLSFVHADTLLLWVDSEIVGPPDEDPIAVIYAGPKAHLRPIHDAFIAALADWGPCDLVPKKGYASIRLRKQICMLGPATNTRVVLGINARGLSPTGRLRALPPGKLCPLKVSLTAADEVDPELMGWVRSAWDQAI
jgi:hypothetical protein